MTDDIVIMVERGDTGRLAEVIAHQQQCGETVRSDDNLLHAAWRANRPLIPWLLNRGVSPDQQDSVGGTVLMYAAAEDAVEVIALLLGRGADVNATNDSGETAFSYACANDGFVSAKRLHEAGAHVNTVDAGGGSPLDWAANWASDDFYHWLVGIGCKHVDGTPRSRTRET